METLKHFQKFQGTVRTKPSLRNTSFSRSFVEKNFVRDLRRLLVRMFVFPMPFRYLPTSGREDRERFWPN